LFASYPVADGLITGAGVGIGPPVVVRIIPLGGCVMNRSA
jgi:hypothetical protein